MLTLPNPLVARQTYCPASAISTFFIFKPGDNTLNLSHSVLMDSPSFFHIVRGGGLPTTGQRSLMVRPTRVFWNPTIASARRGGPEVTTKQIQTIGL